MVNKKGSLKATEGAFLCAGMSAIQSLQSCVQVLFSVVQQLDFCFNHFFSCCEVIRFLSKYFSINQYLQRLKYWIKPQCIVYFSIKIITYFKSNLSGFMVVFT